MREGEDQAVGRINLASARRMAKLEITPKNWSYPRLNMSCLLQSAAPIGTTTFLFLKKRAWTFYQDYGVIWHFAFQLITYSPRDGSYPCFLVLQWLRLYVRFCPLFPCTHTLVPISSHSWRRVVPITCHRLCRGCKKFSRRVRSSLAYIADFVTYFVVYCSIIRHTWTRSTTLPVAVFFARQLWRYCSIFTDSLCIFSHIL